MARPLRVDVADGIYHVVSRGNDRQAIFKDDKERLHFLAIVAAAQERFGLRIHAYVLMDNHFHLIVCAPDANLSRALQWIKTSYSMWFNRRHGRVGPLFQGRFKSTLVDSSESWLVDLSLYVHLNPVRVRSLGLDKKNKAAEAKGWLMPSPEMVKERVAVLRGYRWSSYPYYAGYRRKIPDWLDVAPVLARLGGLGAGKKYRDLAENRIVCGHDEGFTSRLKNRLALGGAEFVEQTRRLFESVDRDLAGHRELREKCSWSDVVAGVERVCGKSWKELQARGEWGRYLAYWGAQRHAGMTLKKISQQCEMKDYGAVNMGIRRLVGRSKKDKSIRKAMGKLDKMFNVQT